MTRTNGVVVLSRTVPTTRSTVLQRAETLSTQIRTTANQIGDYRAELFGQARDVVNEINSKIDSIAALNDRINEATGAATLVAPFSMYSDYEALDCLTAPTSVSLRSVTVAISPLRSTVETAVLVGIAVAGLLTLAALLRKMAA